MLGSYAQAHEQTPAYPRTLPSHVEGVVKVQLQLLNRRKEINYYEIGLFDENFEEVEPKHYPCQYYGLCSECDVKVKTNHMQIFGYTSVDIKFSKSEGPESAEILTS